jgi:hypothetical protein
MVVNDKDTHASAIVAPTDSGEPLNAIAVQGTP